MEPIGALEGIVSHGWHAAAEVDPLLEVLGKTRLGVVAPDALGTFFDNGGFGVAQGVEVQDLRDEGFAFVDDEFQAVFLVLFPCRSVGVFSEDILDRKAVGCEVDVVF